MPRNSVAAVYDRRRTKIHAGGELKGFPTDSATENQTAGVSQEASVRVKRCGKSAPLEAQATRHGKPHRVQGQIGDPGAARSRFRESETDSGYRLLRQMILSIRKGADRIRLTALPKPIQIFQIRRDEPCESHFRKVRKVRDSCNSSFPRPSD